MAGRATVNSIRRLRLRDYVRNFFTPPPRKLCKAVAKHTWKGQVILTSGDSIRSLRPRLFATVGAQSEVDWPSYSGEARRLHQAGVSLEFNVGQMGSRTTAAEVGLVLWSLRALPQAWAEKLISLYTQNKFLVEKDDAFHEISFTREHTFEALVTRDGYQTYGASMLMIPFMALGCVGGGILAGFELPLIQHHMPSFLESYYAGASHLTRIVAGTLVGGFVGFKLPLVADALLSSPMNIANRVTRWAKFNRDFITLEAYFDTGTDPNNRLAAAVVEIVERFNFDETIAGYLSRLDELRFAVLMYQVCVIKPRHSRIASVAFDHPKTTMNQKKQMVLAGVKHNFDLACQIIADNRQAASKIAWLIVVNTRSHASRNGGRRFDQGDLVRIAALLNEKHALAVRSRILAEIQSRSQSLYDALRPEVQLTEDGSAPA